MITCTSDDEVKLNVRKNFNSFGQYLKSNSNSADLSPNSNNSEFALPSANDENKEELKS